MSPNERALLSRQEQFRSVPSTNDVVRGWLTAGTAEVCLAVAGEQTAGRGRSGRTWVAPEGAALLLSLGFRPAYLAPDRVWRLSAIVALAMADAAEDVAGLSMGRLRLKWPNDLVVADPAATAGFRKLAGVLGETEGVGGPVPIAIVGIGTNTDWPKAAFPPELAGSMTSLAEVSGGRPIDNDRLLEAFLLRLEARWLALREGQFDLASWHDRQFTTGRIVRIEGLAGESLTARAVGVDGTSGALLIEDPSRPGAEREVLVGEVASVRLAGDDREAVTQ